MTTKEEVLERLVWKDNTIDLVALYPVKGYDFVLAQHIKIVEESGYAFISVGNDAYGIVRALFYKRNEERDFLKDEIEESYNAKIRNEEMRGDIDYSREQKESD